mgnify:FL=1
MKLSKSIRISLVIAGMLVASLPTFAGNEDRAGSAGATELLINPWSRSSSWGGAGVSSIKGLEALFSNVAGLAYADKTEIIFARTNWLGGISDIALNGFGLAQRVGETGVIGVSIMSMNFGDIPITTTELPEGNIGTFKPVFTNINLAYARQFSSSISGGLNLKVVSEAISNVKASGVAIDIGIRYATGENDQIKFAISLKNVGAPLEYSGDGISLEMLNPNTGILITSEQRVSSFELPSLLHIAASYDFLFDESNKLTMGFVYTSNSFSKDQYRLGGEYTFSGMKQAYFIARAGYIYENGIFDNVNRTNSLTGLSAGLSVDFPVGKNETMIGIDYGYRNSTLGGIHSIGGRINLK